MRADLRFPICARAPADRRSIIRSIIYAAFFACCATLMMPDILRTIFAASQTETRRIDAHTLIEIPYGAECATLYRDILFTEKTLTYWVDHRFHSEEMLAVAIYALVLFDGYFAALTFERLLL